MLDTTLAAASASGKFYAIGGWDPINQKALDVVEAYDPATNSWVTKSHMPTARSGLIVAAINGKIYAFGGINQFNQLLATLEIYDPTTDTWTTASPPPPTNPPSITLISPVSGNQGQTIPNFTVTGSNFDPAATLSFSSTKISPKVPYTSVTPTQLITDLIIDPTAPIGAQDVIVTNSDGLKGTLSGGFTVLSAGQPGISVSPTQITFPPTTIQTTSAPVTVTVSNPGTAALLISDISTQDPFKITNPSANIGNVQPGTTATFDMIFSPTVPGSFSGNVTITSNAPTSPTTVPLTGTAVPMTLTFPLVNRGPYSALINTVFDHHMTTLINPPLPDTYCADDYITAYTGEEGQRQFGASKFQTHFRKSKECPNILNGFKHKDGLKFIITGQYNDKDKDGSESYLFYDGHPGFDYKTTDQAHNGYIPVFAAGDGTMVCINISKTLNPPCTEGPGEIKIEHSSGYFSIYLHLSSAVADPKVGDTVTSGQQIGLSGSTGTPGAHLHFEIREGVAGSQCLASNCIPVDPYGWQTSDHDPYTAAPNAPYIWRSFTEWASPWPAGGAPRGIRVDASGNVWFDQEASQCAIGRLEPQEGNNKFTFWTVDSGASCTRGGIDLEFDAKRAVKYVWFTYGQGEIRRLEPGTGNVTIWRTAGLNPSIVVDRSGVVYFTDSSGNTIGRIDPNTNLYTQWPIPTQASGVSNTTIASTGPFQGQIFFTETSSDKIGKLDPSTGRFTEWSLPSPGGPSGLFIDDKGKVWISEPAANKVAVLDPGRNVVSEFLIPTNSSEPIGITKSAGNLISFVERSGNKMAALIQTKGTPQLSSRRATRAVATTVGLTPTSFVGLTSNFVVLPSHSATVPKLRGNNAFVEADLPTGSSEPFEIDLWNADPTNPHPSTLYITEGTNTIVAIAMW